MLSRYHQKYANQPDGELQRRIDAKEYELIAIKEANAEPITGSELLDVCVMGCGDKRFIEGHRRIFQKVFGRPTHVTTLDINIEHLQGEADAVQHDITQPLPGGPYDVAYAHVVLKFIEESKQWAVVENSYRALKPGGIAVHVLDTEDYSEPDKVKDFGNHPVDIDSIKESLDEKSIKYREVPVEYGLALVLLSPPTIDH
jgi:SAM-dependent methyltransferase